MAKPAREWPLLRSFAGWRLADAVPDAVAGLTLAAIAIPEQMATARLGGLGPEIGFIALIAGAVGFALFGASRVMSVGADSTIAPIFAGALALLAAAGTQDYAASAAALALGVGIVLVFAGVFRLGFVADLLSIPVTTGFLAGIAVHILVSQAPALLGVPDPPGSTVVKLAAAAVEPRRRQSLDFADRSRRAGDHAGGRALSPRAPGALIALGLATALTVVFNLEARGVDDARRHRRRHAETFGAAHFLRRSSRGRAAGADRAASS